MDFKSGPSLSHQKFHPLTRDQPRNSTILWVMSQSQWRNLSFAMLIGIQSTRSQTMTTSVEDIGGTLSGGCLCQATTYTIPKPPQDLPEDFDWGANYLVAGGKGGNNKWAASHCYCDSCRGSVGTLVATWFSIPREEFKLQKKGPTTVYRSSAHATREFVSPLTSLRPSVPNSPADQCSTCGTSLFFYDTHEPGFIDIALASVSVKNISDYFQITAHIWLEDVGEQSLRSKGEGLGLAAIMDDGLPRCHRGRGSERL